MSTFQFKEFAIDQGNASQKITTEAMILGAYANFEGCHTILDIGCGTGLLSLMLAQRYPFTSIVGIDIDSENAALSKSNFARSPWPSRLQFIHGDIRNFASRSAHRFDGIICNPPFYQDQLKSPDSRRNVAAHSEMLTMEELAHCITQLLSESGKAWVLYPTPKVSYCTEVFQQNGLEFSEEVTVRSKRGSQALRSILCFSELKTQFISKDTAIKDEKGIYTEDFRVLLLEFYLERIWQQ